MATNGINHLPHITNVKAGVNHYDPMHQSIFEVYIELPSALQSEFGEDAQLLTEHVTQVDGLDALQRTPGVGQQKFFGVDVSFLNPTLENTRADLTIQFNLNIRNGNDAYILKVFKAWSRLSYDLSDGTRTLKEHYIAPTMRIAEANRDGTIWRSYIFKDVMINEITGLNTLQYTNNEARILSAKFTSDYWEEDLA